MPAYIGTRRALLGGVSIDRLRQSIRLVGGDAFVPAAYWADPTGRKVRLVGSTVAVLDDWRTTTDTGCVAFPGVTGQQVNCGVPTAFDGASLAAWVMKFTAPNTSQSGPIWSQYDAAVHSAFNFRVGGAGNFVMDFSTGIFSQIPASGFASGTLYEILVNYDGTQGTNANRVQYALRSYNQTTQTWSAWSALAAGAVTGTLPAALGAAGAGNLLLLVGSNAAQGASYSIIDRVRAWVGQTLTTAQVSAGPPAPNFDYDFVGSYVNAGSAGHAFDGVPTSGVVLCSDDLTFGPPILFTSRPAWTQNTAGRPVMRFDGLANIGSTALSSKFAISGAYSLAIVAALTDSGASTRNAAAIADSATGNRILGFNTATATNHNIRALQANPTATFADSTIAQGALIRLAIASKDATTGVAIDVPNHARVTAAAGGSVPAGNNALVVGNYWNGSPAANWQAEDVQAILAISKQVSAADIAALDAFAASLGRVSV